MLEIQRRRLDGPPLGPQEHRNRIEMEQAETREEAPLLEYIDVRERHLQRVAFEVLNVSGLSFEESASLAKTIYNLHKEQWDRGEDVATRAAIEEMTVPTTPFDKTISDPVLETLRNAPIDEYVSTPEENEQFEKSFQEYKLGRFVSLEVLQRSLSGEIPSLQITHKEPRE